MPGQIEFKNYMATFCSFACFSLVLSIYCLFSLVFSVFCLFFTCIVCFYENTKCILEFENICQNLIFCVCTSHVCVRTSYVPRKNIIPRVSPSRSGYSSSQYWQLGKWHTDKQTPLLYIKLASLWLASLAGHELYTPKG